MQESGEVAQGRRYSAGKHVAVQKQKPDGGRQVCQRLGDLPGQAILLKVQHVEVLHGAEALRDLALELVLAQDEHLEVGASFQGRGDSSLERVDAQVQELQPAEAAQLRGYLADEMVVAEVKLPEERQVSQGRRDASRQVGGAHAQRDDPLRVTAAAADTWPAAEVTGRVP